MAVGYLFVQALLAAGKDLTREGLLEAVEKGGFQGPGLAPLRFSAERPLRLRRPADEQGRAAACRSYFGPTYETDEGDGPVNEYTVAPPAPPANGIPTL